MIVQILLIVIVGLIVLVSVIAIVSLIGQGNRNNHAQAMQNVGAQQAAAANAAAAQVAQNVVNVQAALAIPGLKTFQGYGVSATLAPALPAGEVPPADVVCFGRDGNGTAQWSRIGAAPVPAPAGFVPGFNPNPPAPQAGYAPLIAFTGPVTVHQQVPQGVPPTTPDPNAADANPNPPAAPPANP